MYTIKNKKMENFNSINLGQRERELLESFSGTYRRLWIQYTRFMNVCITVFPDNTNETYQMYFAHNLEDWSIESLRNIILSQTK